MNLNLSPNEVRCVWLIVGFFVTLALGAIVAWLADRLADYPRPEKKKKDKLPPYLRGPFK